ncbi:hypothetical protein TELCIR_04250 [Teladorsagia circumcincta]|uniref:Uncharacterized protein n=1 Tax=Teladorsagia circumcincta TaxID=45464 RepID=A0A2G9UU46_TELCI|nr:hypothetical protein TELCIR_04250 [Teladorsagia circumcincta]
MLALKKWQEALSHQALSMLNWLPYGVKDMKAHYAIKHTRAFMETYTTEQRIRLTLEDFVRNFLLIKELGRTTFGCNHRYNPMNAMTVISLAVTLTICFTVCFGSLILNTWTYVSWRKRRRKGYFVNKENRVGLNFLVDVWTNRRCFIYMGSIVAVTLISVCYRIGARIEVVWEEYRQAYRWLGYTRVIHSYFPMSSFSILIEPYAILIFCGGVRRELASLLRKATYRESRSTLGFASGPWGKRTDHNINL